jgi:hypothetical protein
MYMVKTDIHEKVGITEQSKSVDRKARVALSDDQMEGITAERVLAWGEHGNWYDHYGWYHPAVGGRLAWGLHYDPWARNRL